MGKDLLLVGSVPLDTAEEVMCTFGGPLAPYLPAMPDGEVGERRSWVNRFCYLVFSGHADLEILQRPPPLDGVEQLLPVKREDTWKFKVRPGISEVRFGLPGLRLGYARDATASYFVFRTLRENGVLPRDLRFQISIPMVNSVVRTMYFPEPGDIDKIRPGFEAALAAELAVITRRIPAQDLAIQWDCAWETAAVYGGRGVPESESRIETHTAPIRRLTALLPPGVALGFHFCFGTFGGWPSFTPPDFGRLVELINASVAAAGRKTDWVHIPALDRADAGYYAPFKQLQTGDARIYMGMIHSMDSLARRIDAARSAIPDFGLAAYCGFGRTPPEQLPQILNDHLKAVEIARRG
ncbi:MAG: hypothetical protein A3G25_10540 [Betaproteobacteria bacterium RIFCSPLOWO2_12_FULL_63_13]|nr:MAG: hypothetical protein A3G25_10540 [Betaproteobacteria bacterium RIFCSPLOWO2_12_FULL_63_13]